MKNQIILGIFVMKAFLSTSWLQNNFLLSNNAFNEIFKCLIFSYFWSLHAMNMTFSIWFCQSHVLQGHKYHSNNWDSPFSLKKLLFKGKTNKCFAPDTLDLYHRKGRYMCHGNSQCSVGATSYPTFSSPFLLWSKTMQRFFPEQKWLNRLSPYFMELWTNQYCRSREICLNHTCSKKEIKYMVSHMLHNINIC